MPFSPIVTMGMKVKKPEASETEKLRAEVAGLREDLAKDRKKKNITKKIPWTLAGYLGSRHAYNKKQQNKR